jgi:hypothetical protein
MTTTGGVFGKDPWQMCSKTHPSGKLSGAIGSGGEQPPEETGKVCLRSPRRRLVKVQRCPATVMRPYISKSGCPPMLRLFLTSARYRLRE